MNLEVNSRGPSQCISFVWRCWGKSWTPPNTIANNRAEIRTGCLATSSLKIINLGLKFES